MATASGGDPKRARRSPDLPLGLAESRDFFDQLLTQVVRARLKLAADESARRRMNIVVSSCTSFRCQLTANGFTMVLLAARMLSPTPEIWLTLTPPPSVAREPLCTILRYSPSSGWVATQFEEPVGDLTVWVASAIAFFLDWASDGAN